jgi:plastocyanin domain-containing protein
VIKFLSPQDYYKQVDSEESPYLLPWEKYRVVPVSKNMKANVYLEYNGENNTPVPYEVTQNVKIEYFLLEKSINYGALLIIGLIGLFIWFLLFMRRRDRRIDILEEEMGYIEAEVDELEK